jgi:hypothetical protein
MKQLTILASVLLGMFILTTQSMAQQVHPTAKAKKAFHKKFPNAQNVSWGKETPSVFEGEFTLNGKRISANFDKQGNWKETETAIPNSKLPSAVKQAYKKGHKMADLKQAFKVAQPAQTVYELEVKMNENSNTKNGEQGEQAENEENEKESSGIYELVYTSNGKLVNEGSESGETGESGESGR